MIDFKAQLKKPWVKYTLIAVGVVGAFVIFKSMSGSSSSSSDSTTSGGESDADYAADTQLAINQQNTSAALAGQSNQNSATLAQLQETDSEQSALANVQLQGLVAQLAAQTTQQSAALNANVAGETLIAQEQEHISDNQTQVALTQTNNSKAVAVGGQQGNLITKSVGAIGAIIGALF